MGQGIDDGGVHRAPGHQGGGQVEARISKLQPHRNPRQRIEFEVLVRL